MTPSIGRSMSRVRGFTLVEVLVGLVVLSIGLLGIASLQLSSLRWNHGASMRSQATLLAYDVLDRMRVNQTSAKAGEYNVAIGATKSAGSVSGDDIIAWKQSLAQTLPGGDGSISIDPAGGTSPTFIITVQWDDTHAEGGPTPTTMSFTMRSQI